MADSAHANAPAYTIGSPGERVGARGSLMTEPCLPGGKIRPWPNRAEPAPPQQRAGQPRARKCTAPPRMPSCGAERGE